MDSVNFKKYFLIIVLTAIFVTYPAICVSAKTAYFVTKNGYSLTEQEFHNLREIVDQDYIYNMDDETIKSFKDGNYSVAEKTVYYETMQEGFKLVTREVDEDWAKINSASTMGVVTSPIHTTNYKQLKLTVATSRSASGLGYKHITVTKLTWLKKPVYSSFDVFGIRCSGNGCGYNGGSLVLKKISSAGTTTVLSPYMSSAIVNNYGAGYAFDTENITSGIAFESTMTFSSLELNTIYASYQHSQGEISYYDATNATISASGYGGVLQFNTQNARNLYDAMKGVSVKTSL